MFIINLAWVSIVFPTRSADLFFEDFSRSKAGGIPPRLLVLGGDFAVKSVGKERFIELAGEPVGLHSVMFGPAKKDGVAVMARVRGTRKGRRLFPVFGVGLNGVSGYRLMVSQAKRKLELLKGDAIVRAVPFEWKPDRWTQLRLECRRVGGGWKLSAKVWADGEKEPAKWLLEWEEKNPPLAGRATVWGVPFSGTPIRFDDLKVVLLGQD
jgi:hypothetical protein